MKHNDYIGSLRGCGLCRYASPELRLSEFEVECGFALSAEIKDWGSDGNDHGGSAE